MNTQSTNQKGANLDSILSSLVEKRTFNNQDDMQDIDSTDYLTVSPKVMVLTEALESFINDKEILKIVRKNPSEQMLGAGLIAGQYLSRFGTEEEKEKVRSLLRDSNPDDVLKLLSLELSGKIPQAEEKRLLELRNSLSLNSSSKRSTVGDYDIKNLTGTLGKGVSIGFKNKYFEHRAMSNNSILRVQKTGDGYKAIMHFDKLDFTGNRFNDYQTLVTITNNIFRMDYTPNFDSFVKSVVGDGYGIGVGRRYDVNGICNIEYTSGNLNSFKREYKISSKNPFVQANFRDHFFERDSSFGKPQNQVSLFVAGMAGFTGLLSLVSHQTGLGYVCGAITSISAAYAISAAFNKDHYGFIEQIVKSTQKNRKRARIKTLKSFDEVVENLQDFTKGLNSPDLESLNKKGQKLNNSLNLLEKDFDELAKCKGYVVEFQGKDLKEVYGRVNSITESISAYNQNPDEGRK